MSVLGLAAVDRAVLNGDPFDHLVVPGFPRPKDWRRPIAIIPGSIRRETRIWKKPCATDRVSAS